MKKMFMMLALALVAASCGKEYDDSAVWDKINGFENHLQGVENKVNALNAATNSLQQIVESLKNRKYVDNVVTTANGYVLNFTDGSSISIANGKDGHDGKDGVNAPVIGIKMDIDGQYYWTQTVNGVTSWLLDPLTNNKISATAKAPLLKVDAHGYWVVSYDGGMNYSRVLDAHGQPIKATGPSGDSLFVSVVVEDKFVTFYLASGEEITLPIETVPVISYDNAVDLGLSVKWAKFNVGSRKNYESGDDFAWGEIRPKTEFTKENYLYFNPQKDSVLIPYKDISGTKYDAARQNWGGRWRMPTHEEMEELQTLCREKQGYYGYGYFSMVNNKSIYLENTVKLGSKNVPMYWTSTRYPETNSAAFILGFAPEPGSYYNASLCCWACGIRPVLDY